MVVAGGGCGRRQSSGGGGWCGWCIVLAHIRIIGGMFEFTMRAQIVAASVRGAAQGTLESAREVDMVVVADVRHYFTAQFAPMQVAAAWQLIKR